MKVTTLYFSATYTTRKVVEAVAANLSNEVTAYDITNDTATDTVAIPADEFLVVGVPVYAGRVPAMAVERLRRYRGDNTPAEVVALAKSEGYESLYLWTDSSCNHDYYAHHGFEKVAEFKSDEWKTDANDYLTYIYKKMI